MRHSKRRAGKRPQRRDAGNIMALEAAVVGMMLMTSVAFVISMPTQSPTPSINAARGPLEAQVRDLLVAMEDIPTGDRYQTVMQRAIARAVQGNTTAFENLIDRAMPRGTECRLWLDNGHARRLVAGPSERLARESVSKSVLWRPTWAYGFVLPSLDLVSELQPLPLQGYQVAQGSLVKEHGVPITATFLTDQGTYDRAALTSIRAGPTATITMLDETGQPGFVYTDQALQWTSTQVHNKTTNGTLGNGSFTVPYDQRFLNTTAYAKGTGLFGSPVLTNITFQDPDGGRHSLIIAAPLPTPALLSIASPLQGNWTYTSTDEHALAYGQLHVNATTLEGNRNWTFVVREEGSGSLPDGTKLTLSFPSVFSAIDGTGRNQSGWRNVTPLDDLDNGAAVTAELDGALTNGQRVLNVTGRRPTSGDALYQVTASLTQGAHARATFVLGGTTGVTGTTNTLDHEMYMSLPKPHAPNATATWGFAFAYPKATTGLDESLIALDLRVSDGTPFFASIQPVSPVTGWMLVSPTHLRWNGTLGVMPNAAVDFVVKVTTVAQRTPDEPGIHLPIQFEGNTHVGAPPLTNFTFLDQARPYVHQFNVPPPKDVLGNTQKGYHRPSGAPDQRQNASLEATGVIRGMLASGTANYGVTAWGSVSALAEATRNGFGKSHLNMSQSGVRIGQNVTIEIDFQSLSNEVNIAATPPITSWKVELRLYDPAQAFETYGNMIPTFRGEWGANLNPPRDLEATQPYVTKFIYDNGTAELFSAAHGNLTFTVPPGAFYGPHLIVAQANFVINDAMGNSMVQTVRQLGVLEVVPDSGQAASALYWATLECWLPDW